MKAETPSIKLDAPKKPEINTDGLRSRPNALPDEPSFGPEPVKFGKEIDVNLGGELRSASGTQTVYRAVDAAENASINSAKSFLLRKGGTEVKYFAKTLEDAHWYGSKLYPKGYSVIQGTVESSVNIGNYWHPHIDIGAYVFPKIVLPYIKPIVFPY